MIRGFQHRSARHFYRDWTTPLSAVQPEEAGIVSLIFKVFCATKEFLPFLSLALIPLLNRGLVIDNISWHL
jgi:hypothetical protein